MPSGGRTERHGEEQAPVQAPEGAECPGGGDVKQGAVLRRGRPQEARTQRKPSGNLFRKTRVKKARDRDDWQVEQAIFEELDLAYGPFTLDACADEGGKNAFVPRYCSPRKPLQEEELKDGDKVWMNPPYSKLEALLQTYLRKVEGKDVTGVLVLPKWLDSAWWELTDQMELIHEFQPGEQVFTAPGPGGARIRMGPIRWPVCVFLHESHKLSGEDTRTRSEEILYEVPELNSVNLPVDRRRQLVTLRGDIKGRRVDVLVDSGSMLDLISTSLAEELDLEVSNARPGYIAMANGERDTCREVQGSLPLRLGRWTEDRRFHATNLQSYDLILGMPWLREFNPHICWRTQEILVKTRLGTVKLWPRAPRGQSVGGSGSQGASGPPGASGGSGGACSVEVVNFKQMRRSLKKDNQDHWLGFLMPMEELQILQKAIHQVEILVSGESGEIVPTHPDPKVEKLLRKHKRLFQALRSRPPQKRKKHVIRLEPDTEPQVRPAYRLSPAENDEVLKQLEKLLGLGFIRKSSSPWGAPVLFARKKSGELRMCIDYRMLNAHTVKDRTTLPLIDELLDRISQAKYFSKLDLASGYWQVAMEEESVPYTAFRTKYGSYEWLVMPFGLTNAPATFQGLMTEVLEGLIDKCCLCYLDDVLVFSRSYEEHLQDLERVLTRLDQAELKVQLKKCEWLVQEVEFLGFIVGGGKLKPDPGKVRTIQEWPLPETPKEVRSFIGLAGYYRRFIHKFSKKAAPLHNLTKQGVVWSWGAQEGSAFKQLKEALTSRPVLLLPDFTKDFQLTTDASTVAVAAILEQEGEDGLMHPVAYYSRKLNIHEANYSSYDLEALGVVEACKHFRCYLERRHFKLKTDHEALVYLYKQVKLNRRQAHWVEELSNFTFTIEYKPGRTNPADAPSRRPDYARALQIERLQASGKRLEELRSLRGVDLQELEGKEGWKHVPFKLVPERVSGPSVAFVGAVEIEDIRDKVRKAYDEDPMFRRHLRSFTKEDGCYFQGGRLAIPTSPDTKELKDEILRLCHEEMGHFGRERTLQEVLKLYWWPTVREDVQRYVATCPTCQRVKPGAESKQGELHPLPIPQEPFEQVTMDLLTALPTTTQGHDAVVVFVDRLTKYAIVEPCTKKATAKDLATIFVNSVFSQFGLPKVLISDRAPTFTSNFWEAVFAYLDTKLNRTTSRHPQSDGQTERTNRTLLSVLRSHALNRREDWDTTIKVAQFQLNAATHKATRRSPFEALFGFSPRSLPKTLKEMITECSGATSFVEDMTRVREDIKKKLEANNEDMAKRVNKGRKAVEFKEGDEVLVSTNLLSVPEDLRKLGARFVGPYKVSGVPTPVNVIVDLPPHYKTHRRIHVEHVRLFRKDDAYGDRYSVPPPEIVDGSKRHEVSAIRGRRKRYGRWEYLVAWEGYDPSEDLWLPPENLGDCQELVEEYDRLHPF